MRETQRTWSRVREVTFNYLTFMFSTTITHIHQLRRAAAAVDQREENRETQELV